MNDMPVANNGQEMLFTGQLFGLALAAFFVLLIYEKKHPFLRFSPTLYKESIVTNLSAFLTNNLILTALKASSLYLVAQKFSGFGLLAGLDNNLFKWLLTFAFYDLAIYGWHVASHHSHFLWRFHKVHHSDKSFNASTGFRFHVIDLLLEIVYKCVFVVLVGVDAYIVLSIEIIELFFIFFHHANISFAREQQLSQVIITPYLHRLHHSTLRSEHDSNYGIVLSIWDRLFGTRKELVPNKIGLELLEADNVVQLFSLAFITESKVREWLRWIPKGKK